MHPKYLRIEKFVFTINFLWRNNSMPFSSESLCESKTVNKDIGVSLQGTNLKETMKNADKQYPIIFRPKNEDYQ